MDILKFSALALILSILIALLKSVSKTYALYAGLASGVVLLLIIMDDVLLLWQRVSDLTSSLGGGEELVKLSLKMIALSYISEISANICEECGALGVADKVRFFGKITVFSSIFPMIAVFLEGVLSLL